MREWVWDTLVGLPAEGEGSWALRGVGVLQYWVPGSNYFYDGRSRWVPVLGAGRSYAQSRLFWEDRT